MRHVLPPGRHPSPNRWSIAMIEISLEGEEKIAAAVDEFIEEAKVESSVWLKNAGYAISGTAGSRIRARTRNRLHMYPSVRQIGDDVRLQIKFKKSKPGARKLARRSLAEASNHIWAKWRVEK